MSTLCLHQQLAWTTVKISIAVCKETKNFIWHLYETQLFLGVPNMLPATQSCLMHNACCFSL